MVELDREDLKGVVASARAKAGDRKFRQSFEMYLVLDPKKVKKDDVQVNEVVALPNRFSSLPKVALIAGGEMATKAKEAGIDLVISPDDVDRLSTNKRELKRIIREYDFFASDASLMPKVGRSLGRYLGPRGKMPIPVPSGSSIQALADRLRSSVRARARAQLAIAAKIGDIDMPDEKVAENARALLNALKDKVPQGERSIKKIVIKATMGKPVELTTEAVKAK
ncbi:MAG: 50S ribosomal protein L1 [Desulfurococcaceae archaeon]